MTTRVVLFAVLAALPLAACGSIAPFEQFPLVNETTGAEVMCRSPLSLGGMDAHGQWVVDQCIHACEREGFSREPFDPMSTPAPAAPAAAALPYVPPACLR